MPTNHSPDALATLLQTLAALLAVTVGVIVLFGWTFDITALKSMLPGWVSMKANTAVCFILTGAALWLTVRASAISNPQRSTLFTRLARAFGLLAGLIGLLTLGEYVFGWNLGIDQLLFRELTDTVGTSHPGRMAPEAALNFVLLSVALWLASGSHRSGSSIRAHRAILASASLGLLVAIFALSALLSRLTPGLGAYGWFGLTLMALHTATLFAMLGMAVIAVSWQPGILSWSLNGRTTAAFACGLGMLAFIGLSASRSQLYMNDINRQIVYGEQVMSNISGLLIEVIDAQANARGFVISGDERVGNQYLEAKNNSNARLDALRKHMAGSPQRQQQFAQIEMRANAMLRWLQQAVDIERNSMNDAARSKRVAHGEGLMDSLRSTLGQIASEHRQLIRQLEQEAEGVDALFYRIIFFSTLASLMIFLIVMFRLNSTTNERKRKEDEYRTIIYTSFDGFCTADFSGRILDVNEAYCQMLGYTREEFLRLQVQDFEASESPEETAAHFQKFIRTGSDRFQTRQWRKDGEVLDVEVSVQYVAALGERIFSFVRDITERKQAEVSLRNSEYQLRTVIENLTEGLAVSDLDGQLRHFNRAALDLHGYTTLDECRQHLSKFADTFELSSLDGTVLPLDQWPLARVLRGENLRDLEVYIRHIKAGWKRVYSYGGTLVHDAGGQPLLAIVTISDITERKQAEESIRASQARFGTIFNQAPLGIALIDSFTGQIREVNTRFAEIAGRTIEEMATIDWMSITHPDDVQEDLDNMALLNAGKIPGFRMEKRYIRPDGSFVWINMTIAPLRGVQDISPHHLCMIEDITERKRVEQEILTLNTELEQRVIERTAELEAAKEKAELANRAKDSFLATMSHEIRTPLTGMLGMLEMLSLTSLDRDQGETLRAVWDSSRSLLRIVNDILDWSKIVEGKLALAPQSTSIPQLLQEVVNTYSRVASAKSLVLWQHADARLSPAHIVDALRLSQILNNFASNAIKFTQRGEIELRAELLEQLNSGERIRFSVKDTGIGIAKDVQQHLFQRYRQAGSDTARMYGGTGLGLSICRRLADLMDGQIELISEPGQGSIFSLTLTLPVSGTSGELIPTLFPDMEQRKVKPLLDGSMDAPLVLAVDDHPTNRDLLVRQIKLLGLRTETAENGQEALSLWRKGRFALVITDCHMPEMDGYALSQAIRKIEAEKKLLRTPVIAWTANALAEEKGHCQAAGMDDLLVKPADLAQLKKMLAKWLSLTETDSSQPAPSTHDAEGRQAAGPIDYAVLNEAVPDPAERIRALHDFQAQIRADRAKLLEAMEQGDQANVERTAHRMKGSCQMVGASELASACAAIEQAARDGNTDGARAARAGLDDAIKRLETYLAEAGKHEEKADEN